MIRKLISSLNLIVMPWPALPPMETWPGPRHPLLEPALPPELMPPDRSIFRRPRSKRSPLRRRKKQR